MGAVLAAAVLPLSPPTDAIGDAGWAVAAASALISLAGAAVLLRRARVPYAVLLLGGYVGLAQIAVAQWLAGGLEAPYWQLFILPALQIAAVHPARRVVPFFAVLLAAPRRRSPTRAGAPRPRRRSCWARCCGWESR